MNELHEQLKGLGLSTTEATIYLAGINNPPLGVAELQKVTAIKRPTIYHALYELIKKGLVAKTGTEARLKFAFAPPEQLENVAAAQIAELQDRSRTIQQLVSTLAPLANTTQSIVAHYEGVEGVKTVVDAALYCKVPKWDILAPKKNFFSDFDAAYAKYFMRVRQNRRIVSRSLWEAQVGSKALTPEDLVKRQPRYVPQVMHGQYDSVIILFDDKVAIISSVNELSAILITSSEIHRLFSAMFEGLWSASSEKAPAISVKN